MESSTPARQPNMDARSPMMAVRKPMAARDTKKHSQPPKSPGGGTSANKIYGEYSHGNKRSKIQPNYLLDFILMLKSVDNKSMKYAKYI